MVRRVALLCPPWETRLHAHALLPLLETHLLTHVGCSSFLGQNSTELPELSARDPWGWTISSSLNNSK